jgi:hypothetical protein
LIPTANLMLNYILKPVRHEAFRKKYAGKRFQKVSTARFYLSSTSLIDIVIGESLHAGMGSRSLAREPPR